MSKLSCYCGNDCTVLSVIASIVIGVVATVLNITATIALGVPFLWAALGIALFFFAVTLVGSGISQGGCRSCVCSTLTALIWGVLGTTLAAVILLLVDLAAAGVVASLIVGGLAGFFTLVLTSVACLIKCLSGCNQD